MISTALRAAGIGAAALAAAAGGAALPAQAAGATEGKATTVLQMRYAPSTASDPRGTILKNATFDIECKIRGTKVDGNSIWYLLPPGNTHWVSARYVTNVGAAPEWCSSLKSANGVTTAAVNLRQGPTQADAVVGRVAKGQPIRLLCKVRSDTVDGNTLWYHTADERWISARYVSNRGAAPEYCSGS